MTSYEKIMLHYPSVESEVLCSSCVTIIRYKMCALLEKTISKLAIDAHHLSVLPLSVLSQH